MSRCKIFLDYDTLINNSIKNPDILEKLKEVIISDKHVLNIIVMRPKWMKFTTNRKLKKINISFNTTLHPYEMFKLDYNLMESLKVRKWIMLRDFISDSSKIQDLLYCDDNEDILQGIMAINFPTCKFRNIIYKLEDKSWRKSP